jgi:hypothetical protein
MSTHSPDTTFLSKDPAGDDRRADLLGIACSAGCAVHCAAMPIIASAAPAIGLGWLAGSLFHQVVAALCCFFVIRAIVPRWRTHRDKIVAFSAGFGLGLLVLAAFILPDPCCEPSSIFGWIGFPLLTVGQLELVIGPALAQQVLLVQPYLTPIGGVLLVAAHVMNLDLARRADRVACVGEHGLLGTVLK